MPMFEGLSSRLDGIFKDLRKRGKLNEADVDAAMREIRLALLEACLLYTSPSPRDRQKSRMPSSA